LGRQYFRYPRSIRVLARLNNHRELTVDVDLNIDFLIQGGFAAYYAVE
jgi:hypothetical protein